MWMRLTFVKIQLEKMDEIRQIYNEDIVPTVKAQKGNVDVFFLESVDEEGEVISFTSWDRKEDGDTPAESSFRGTVASAATQVTPND